MSSEMRWKGADGKEVVVEWAPGVTLTGRSFTDTEGDIAEVRLVRWTPDDMLKAGLLVEVEVCQATKLYVAINDMSDGLSLTCNNRVGHGGNHHDPTTNAWWS